MDNTDVKRETKFSLENVLIIDFIKAIDNNDPSIIDENMTVLELENLYIDYEFEFRDEKEDFVEIMIEQLEMEIFVISILLDALNVFYDDTEVLPIILSNIKDAGYILREDTMQEDIDKILLEIKRLEAQISNFQTNLKVEQPTAKTKKQNIYSTLAKLSLNLKFELDYNSLTIIKFIYYIKALKDE